MRILAIDPGNIKSAYCIIDKATLQPLDFDILENEQLRTYIGSLGFAPEDRAAIEMVASYGMAVGEEVFETVRWVGRFEEMLIRQMDEPPVLIKRMEEKIHICHNSRARDTNIRVALIDRFARHDKRFGRGTKKDPDWFYGFKADIWAAYSVALVAAEIKFKDNSQN